MSKRANLLLLAILSASSLILSSASSVFAQSSTLSVPEFTAKYIDKSYDVPESTSIDPYTGKTVTNPGYYVENKFIELTIKDQNVGTVHYDIIFKGHFEEKWHSIFMYENSPTYRNVSIRCSESQSASGEEIYAPPGGQIDFKVAAFRGGYTRDFSSPLPFMFFNVTERSGWSSIQTITIPASTSSPTSSPSPTPTPDQGPQQTEPFPTTLVIASAVLVAVICIGLLVYFKKRWRFERKR
jgi:hypothetical protein